MRLLPDPISLSLALLLAVAAHPAEAQRFGQPVPGGNAGGWPNPWAGIRVGWDYNNQATVLGAQLRIPVLPTGHVELVPNGDITFLTGLREYQGGVDAVAVSGGRRGGVFAGVGLAWRNTVWDEGSPRRTRTAPVTVAGVWSNRMAGAPFGTQLEVRWTWLDRAFKPRVLSLGVNFPLWGGGR